MPDFIQPVKTHCSNATETATLRSAVRSSGFRIILLLRLPVYLNSGFYAAFVPDYSGGSATDLHRLPICPADSYINVKVILFYTSVKEADGLR